MLSRDLTATVIKTFFEQLNDVRDGNRNEGLESSYSPFYNTYFGKDREWFLRAETKDITTFFADDPIHRLEMLAELMYRDVRKLTDAEIQGIMFRKLIGIYEEIDVKSMEFSMERMNRVTELKKLLGE